MPFNPSAMELSRGQAHVHTILRHCKHFVWPMHVTHTHLVCTAPCGCCPLAQGGHSDLAADHDNNRQHHDAAAQWRGRADGEQDKGSGHPAGEGGI